MSVLSKALSVAIIFGFVIGCSAGQSDISQSDSGDYQSDSSSKVGSAEIGSEAASEEDGDSEEQTSSLDTVKREQLTSASQNGFDILLEQSSSSTKLILGASPSTPYEVMSLNNPPRLVLDLMGVKGKKSQAFYIDSNPYVEKLRVGVHKEKSRVVFDLPEGSDATEPTVSSHQDGIAVTFAGGEYAPVVEATLETEKIEPIQVEEIAELDAPADAPKEEVVADLVLDSMRFDQTADSSAQVVLSLTGEAPFDLRKSAPTEYVLTVAGTSPASRTLIPQLAPEGVSGIRTARAVVSGDHTQVRMFVEEGIHLVARPNGSEIVVTAQKVEPARMPEARAQLGEDEEEIDDAEDIARVNPTGIVSDDGTKLYTGRLISLDLQDTDIDNALRIIAEVSNLNIIASDDVTGKVTLRLIDVPWDQALDVILKTNGLDQVTEGNVIRIAPVEKLRQEREARREALRALENLEELKVGYYRVSYAKATEIVEQVETVLSERGSLSVDERTNQLIVKDIKKGQEEALNLIKRLDLRTPQVLLETQIVEGQRSIIRDLGFQWAFGFRQSPETGNATGINFPNTVDAIASAGFPASITTDGTDPRIASSGSLISLILDSADGSRSLSANLSALEQEGRARIVSKPQVATVNNKQAVIQSVETVRIRLPDSGLSVATGSGASSAGGGSSAFEEIDVGIEMTVTPNASPDYFVLLDVDAESSTFGDREVDGIPSTIERRATSTILVKSGQTFALGGVYRIEDNDNVSGVPWLKDIPILGHVFRSTRINKGDEELIFFITPHIVEGSFDPSLM